MTEQERARWEQFCRTGAVSDYLEYRAEAVKRRPAPQEEPKDAAWNQSRGPLGQKPGGP